MLSPGWSRWPIHAGVDRPTPRIRQGVRSSLCLTGRSAPTNHRQDTMKLQIIAALSIASAAALPLAAVANACGEGGEIPQDYDFATPSGNIVCSVYADSPGVNCEVRVHSSVAPTSTIGPYGRTCGLNFGGLEFYVSQAKPANLGCYEGASKFSAPQVPTLDYGQAYSHGAITCDSRLSGVTCTDTSTGHFFRVSRESYELG